MNARARIVCSIVVVAMLLTVACRSGDEDVTPASLDVPVDVPVDVEAVAAVDGETETVVESLPVVVAQVETAVPAEPTPTSRSTQAPTVTNTPTNTLVPDEVETVDDDAPEPTATETRRAFTVRTEVPTVIPVGATETPAISNVLLVPTPRTYTVRDGDTIKSIAHFCEVTVVDLLEENDIEVEEADKIVPGQVLRIPEAN